MAFEVLQINKDVAKAIKYLIIIFCLLFVY